MSHISETSEAPTRYTVVLKPRVADEEGRPDHGNPLRTVPVTATGEEGASGYPRYAGEGVQADIDPRTRTVEAVTVDGEELPIGWVAEVADA
ncbi:hypothetical protein [Streptomyces sp. NPDC046939]|uniref:hypothetical protein n=1 Tax=Streptomyces sp. NPDC046939 TaxID=3155376 RepID=UPI0033C56230